MTTCIRLEDGRVWGTTNGLFDAVLETAAAEIERRPGGLEGLAGWLLEQTCKVQGPGVGRLDMREMSPKAREEFKRAFMAAHEVLNEQVTPLGREHLSILLRMWDSIAKGEPPTALTSEHWRIVPHDGTRCGPGWPEA